MAETLKPLWQEFEVAVAKFAQALDPNAVVRHNVSLPDKNTGLPRQRDVWVEAKICNHFPIKVYISCKRVSRKLSQQDIDAFNGELLSSGANKGVIYSYVGFTKPAITKAKDLGISCCRLYQNSPPELPSCLVIKETYVFYPTLQLSVTGYPTIFRTWNDIFDLDVLFEGKQNKAIDVITEQYLRFEKENATSSETGIGPSDWSAYIDIQPLNREFQQFRVTILGRWKAYRGKLNAYLIDGSYSYTEEEFLGSQSTPAIDTQSPHPGSGWELVTNRPFTGESARLIFFGGDVKGNILCKTGSQLLQPC